MSVFDPSDFGIGPQWRDNEVFVNHFEVADELRGQKIGSAILETMKRVYYYENADKIVVRMGGGDGAVEFLQANDFTITKRIDEPDEEIVEGGGIVVGEYVY